MYELPVFQNTQDPKISEYIDWKHPILLCRLKEFDVSNDCWGFFYISGDPWKVVTYHEGKATTLVCMMKQPSYTGRSIEYAIDDLLDDLYKMCPSIPLKEMSSPLRTYWQGFKEGQRQTMQLVRKELTEVDEGW